MSGRQLADVVGRGIGAATQRLDAAARGIDAMHRHAPALGREQPARSVEGESVHAVQRARVLSAQALGYTVPDSEHFGLSARMDSAQVATKNIATGEPLVALVHGTSRQDKEWPLDHWLQLGYRLNDAGFAVAVAHGSDAEQRRQCGAVRQQVRQRIADLQPDVIGCTAITPAIYKAERLLQIAKEVNPACVTVLGGIHGTFMYPQVLKEAPWIDAVVRGEGEIGRAHV